MTVLHWLTPWEPSPTVIFFLVATACAYLCGTLRATRHPGFWRQLAWWLGWGTLYVGLQTHLDYYAEHQFFVHRLQHLGLHHLGPFLIVLSRPGDVLMAGLPAGLRERIVTPALASPPLRWLRTLLFHPLVASLLFVGLIYFWLYDPVHYIAMLDVRLYRLMNWSMTVDGLLFWWIVLDTRPKPPARLSPGMRIIVALAVIPPQILIGAYITFTRHALYPIYEICGRVMPGVDALVDQQIGGLILWIPSSMMSVVAALVALHSWVTLDRQRRQQAAAASIPTGPARPAR